MQIKPKPLAALATAALFAGGGGVALAASDSDSSSPPRHEPHAFLKDVARRLGVSQDELAKALKGAAIDRIEAAQAAGRLTEKQADAIESRIRSGDLPPLPGASLAAPGPRLRMRLPFGGADGPKPVPGPLGGPGVIFGAAADYLGISRSKLGKDLADGKSLADLAKSAGKSVDGLRTAIVDAMTARLDKRVAAGDLTNKQERRILDGFEARLDGVINGTPPRRRVRPERGVPRGAAPMPPVVFPGAPRGAPTT